MKERKAGRADDVLQVWVLDYGVPGHTVQAEGVTSLLEEAGVRVRVSRLRYEVTLRGWLRGVMRVLVSYLPSGISWPLVRRFHRGLTLPPGDVDLIVGSGGTSLWLLKSLGKKMRARTIHVGLAGSFPRSWYQSVLSPLPENGFAKVIETPRLVTGMNPELAASYARESGHSVAEKDLVAVLVGGRSRSHLFGESDWREMGEGLNELGRAGFRFLLTTSRRTGARAEGILREVVKRDFLVDSVWWSEQPRKVVGEFLGRCEQVLVTRDSLTMVSEAIDSGRPVWGIVPERVTEPEGSLFSRYCRKLEESNCLKIVACDALGDCRPYESKEPGEDWQRVGRELAALVTGH